MGVLLVKFARWAIRSSVASQVTAEALHVDAFRDERQRHGAFYNVVIRYSQALTTQLTQTTVCNSLHSPEQRRWLLTPLDRLESETVRMTHEFVAQMLGLRRPTVTLVLGELLARRAIDCRRGLITMGARPALELTACECYEPMKGHGGDAASRNRSHAHSGAKTRPATCYVEPLVVARGGR